MDPVATALRILLVTIAASTVVLLLIALAYAARNPSKAMRAAGATLMFLGWGNLRDPRDNPVAEAQDGRIRGSEESGDPPARD